MATPKYTPLFETVNRPPPLPDAIFAGTERINNVDLWYGIYGTPLKESMADGYLPVVFLHGGFANSEWWSYQIRYLLDSGYSLLAIDSRAQGRSSDDPSLPITYDLMMEDVISLMDTLGVGRFQVVGWSDGSDIAFNLAMNYPSRLDRAFAFGGTYSWSNIKETALSKDVVKAFMEWVREDFPRLSPSKDFDEFNQRMMTMWTTLPNWDAESFSKIPTLYSDPKNAPIMWIVAAEQDEGSDMEVPYAIHSWIPGSSFLALPGVSHWALVQDPKTFNLMLRRFLEFERR